MYWPDFFLNINMMNMKQLAILLLLLAPLSVSAQKIASGYYRVQNKASNRFFMIVDDRAWVNANGGDVNTGALRTVLGFNEKVVWNPATVCFVEQAPNGTQYNIIGAGLDLYQKAGIYLDITLATADGAYTLTGSKDGVGKMLYDGSRLDSICYIYTNGASGYQYWYFRPVKDTGNYPFGIKPTVAAGDKYYTTMYASFPFKVADTNVKAYYVKKIVDNYAIIAPLTVSVPESTPVLLECNSQSPFDNIVNLQGSSVAVSTNLLKGVYFCNDVNESTGHRNVVEFNGTTMRVLGTDIDGNLAFVTSPSPKYIPANSAYLQVPAGSPTILKVITEEEYTAGVLEMSADSKVKPAGVYTLGGQRVADTLDGLPRGIYVTGGKKVVVK